MKKMRLVKIILAITICLLVVLSANQVFAANNIITDLTNTIDGNTSSGNASLNNAVSNNTTNSVGNNTINNATNNAVLTTNNTSNYNDANLPKTGIEDSIPAVLLVVVFGISAVYAYKKIQDYKNI